MKTKNSISAVGLFMLVTFSVFSQPAVINPPFTKITTGSIVEQRGTGLGCAWGDYDNDGFIDLVITQSFDNNRNAAQRILLFQNNRDGTFKGVTNTVVTSEARDWRGCAWADYDNDGHLDLFVTSTDYRGPAAQNELFRNNGDGTFTKMSSTSVGSIVDGDSLSEGAVWADYDGDGFLDLFLSTTGGSDRLYHNRGDGGYNAVSNAVAGSGKGNSYFAAWGDYNNDGRPDLFVAVETGLPSNLLYTNQGGGLFQRISNNVVVATDGAHSFGCAWGDYDNDGSLDLFVANGGYVGAQTNFLYHNNGDLTFTRVMSAVAGSIASDSGPFVGCDWGDYDNDGFLDLFVTSAQGKNYLYHNRGDGSFVRVLNGSPVDDSGVYASGTWGDYDNDGFLDLFVSRGGLNYTPDFNLLYHNEGNSNGWIKVRLTGTVSNRSAIGAKVRLRASIVGKMMWLMREINTGNGFSAGPLEAHFGLGDAAKIETLRIEWPSGTVQEFHDVASRQTLMITEPARLFSGVRNGLPRFNVKGGRFLEYGIEGSSDFSRWSVVTHLTITNIDGTAEFTETNAPAAEQRFYRAFQSNP
jgi:hypothetical protein